MEVIFRLGSQVQLLELVFVAFTYREMSMTFCGVGEEGEVLWQRISK